MNAVAVTDFSKASMQRLQGMSQDLLERKKIATHKLDAGQFEEAEVQFQGILESAR